VGISNANLSLELTSLKESTLLFTLRDFLIIALAEHFKMILTTDIQKSFYARHSDKCFTCTVSLYHPSYP